MHKKLPYHTWKAVTQRDGGACVLCGDSRYIHLHHYISRGQGGNDCESNIVSVCPPCHRVLHGEYEYTHDFPFDKATAEDALYHYLSDYYAWGGGGLTPLHILRVCGFLGSVVRSQGRLPLCPFCGAHAPRACSAAAVVRGVLTRPLYRFTLLVLKSPGGVPPAGVPALAVMQAQSRLRATSRCAASL